MPKSELERRLEQLDALHQKGLLTDSEHEEARRRAILSGDLGQDPAPREPTVPVAPRPQGGGCSKALLWIFAIVGVLVVAAIVIIIVAVVVSNNNDSAPAATSSTPSGFMRVGSVEIQVLDFEHVNTTRYNILNDENLRIHVRVRKIKGDTYEFRSRNKWVLVTSAGTGIEHSAFCFDCPDDIDNLAIYGDQPIEAYVYFELPTGSYLFRELRYEPWASGNEGMIPLRVTATIN